jgi:L-asparagine transporter-like permease
MEDTDTPKEFTLEQKIRYSGYIAKMFMVFALVFIFYALAVRIISHVDTNPIAIIGLMFCALFGVFVWMKKKLEQEKEDETSTYHGPGS